MKSILRKLLGSKPAEDSSVDYITSERAKYTVELSHDPTRVYAWRAVIREPNGNWQNVSADTERGARRKARNYIDAMLSKTANQTIRGDEL